MSESNVNMETYNLISRLITHMPMIIYVLDINGIFLVSEGEGLKKIGLRPGEVVGVSARELYKNSLDVMEALDRAYQGERVMHTHRMGDLYIEHYVAPYYDEQGNIEGVIGATIDITERIINEQELEKARTLQQALMDSIPGILYIYNEKGELVLCNKSHQTMTGYTKEELDYFPIEKWFVDDPESKQKVKEAMEQTVRDGVGRVEAYLTAKDGTKLPFYMTACALKVDGKIYHLGMGIDITSRIEAENQIRELNRTLEQKVQDRTMELSAVNEELIATNQELYAMNEEITTVNEQLVNMQKFLVESEKMAALGGLVAGVAHEVNTPLGIGLTAASHLSDISNELLEIGKTRPLTDQDVISYLEDIEKASGIIVKNLNRAAQLIQSFKQLSVDQSTEPKRQFDIGAYIEEILVSLSPTLKKTQINISSSCSEQIIIYGYPGAIAQIITNLVMNSLKHAFRPGESGQITIFVTRNNQMVQIVFTDDGTGIEESTLNKIFDPFFTTNRAGGGTGLGLSIVYSLVTQLYEGSIRCESKPGSGTTFIIQIKEDAK